MKYLATLNETVEIEMLRDLLETNNILLMTKHRETGEFLEIYAGMTIFGADLYVAEPQFDAALELYQAFFSGTSQIDEESLEEQALHAENPEELAYDESKMKMKMKMKMKIYNFKNKVFTAQTIIK